MSTTEITDTVSSLDLPNNATAPAPQEALGLGSSISRLTQVSLDSANMAFAKQLFGRYRFGVREEQSIQAGRFEFNDASELAPKNATVAALKRDRVSQRLIGTFGWSDVGRSFDGIRYSWTQPSTDFTFVGATPTRGVFQTDGWGWNRIGFAYAAFTKEWGHGNHSADTRFFAIDYDDLPPYSEDRQPSGPCPLGRHGKYSSPDVGRPQSSRIHDQGRNDRCPGLGGVPDRALGHSDAAGLGV